MFSCADGTEEFAVASVLGGEDTGADDGGGAMTGAGTAASSPGSGGG